MAKYIIEFPEGRSYFPEFLPTDDFYSGIYIAPEHLSAYVTNEADTLDLQMTILIEEMSELAKELCKWKRLKGKRGSITEEMAHVLITMKCVARVLGIKDNEVEAEIQKKWPSAYSEEKTDE